MTRQDIHTDPDLEHVWRLEDIYSCEREWQEARDRVGAGLAGLEQCAGSLGASAASLLSCLDICFELTKETQRVSAYAAMLSDQDTRHARALEMRQETGLLATRLSEAASFVEPEVLRVGEPRIREFLDREPALGPYRQFLQDILRRRPHTLGQEAESVIASASLMADTAYTVYTILANAEIPWPTVTLADGSEARLDQSGYARHRAAPLRADREQVFDAFWGAWKGYERTCGVALYSQLKRDLFYARTRSYSGCLAASLDGSMVPERVYTTLVDEANASLDTLHRYLRLRGRLLGVKDPAYYDLYPPLVTNDLGFDIATARELVLDALDPLGEEYVAVVKHGFDSRWMDVFPRSGKQSGAYALGHVYDVHPFVLMNFNDDFESVSTLAHEWGHAMHSHLANTTQPYPTADYSIFMAEVASTLNEALLLDHMLDRARDQRERLFYLGSALEGLRGTFFRQAMFAEFELTIHRLVEAGEALSGERLSGLYGELLRRHHGHDAGVMHIADEYTVEWAYVPHFFYDFYVYQYATSLAAASLLAEKILARQPGAAERYLDLLRAGGSQYPYPLLVEAGVDLATAEPYQALVRRMDTIMDEIEGILEG